MSWTITQLGKKPNLRTPVFVEGLPGIGNVGKVAVDFMIDKLKAKKIYDLSSHSFPPSVYINEKNLVELPAIEIYYKKLKGEHDLLILAGDVQPINEESSYEFSELILDIFQKYKGKEIVTLGGIGLSNVPKKPKVYATANSMKIMEKYAKSTTLNVNSYGVIGPIMGISGLLVGLAKKREIESVAMLAETYGHPMYLGIKGAREILKILNAKLELGLNLKDLDKEIKEIEEEMKKIKGLENLNMKTKDPEKEMNYIG